MTFRQKSLEDIEDWQNSRQFVYWSQIDTVEARDYDDSK